MEGSEEVFEPVIETEDEEAKSDNGALIEEESKEKEPEPEANGEDKIASLENELASVRADFYNYRQRVTKEKQEARRRTEEDVITSLLPVLDNLDRALMVPEDGTAKDVLVGVRMVQRQFLTALDEFGISVIPTEGQRFDARLHEAVGTVQVEEPEQDGSVVEEQLRGYMTKEGRVLRASRVTVGRLG